MLKKPECRPWTNTVASPKQILSYLKQGCEIKQIGDNPRISDGKPLPKYYLLSPHQQWEFELDREHVLALEKLELITVDCCGGNYWISKANFSCPVIENVPQFCCECGWKGDSHELKRHVSVIHADSWYGCPDCGRESTKLNRINHGN